MGYIPVAMPPERYPNNEKWITAVFEEHGLTDIRMWTDLGGIDSRDIADVSAVYIGGGNTYRLLHQLRQTDSERMLREFVAMGGRLYGGSAGAIICGETIQTTHDVNRTGVIDSTGLQFLPGIDIWCHYTDTDDSEIFDYVTETGRKVIAIPERSGISVTAARSRVVGHVPTSIFDASEKTTKSPGEQFRL